jgi:hypothetical protein
VDASGAAHRGSSLEFTPNNQATVFAAYNRDVFGTHNTSLADLLSFE